MNGSNYTLISREVAVQVDTIEGGGAIEVKRLWRSMVGGS
jgi:hypothetical protein